MLCIIHIKNHPVFYLPFPRVSIAYHSLLPPLTSSNAMTSNIHDHMIDVP